jgi:hypothetical protein
MGNQVGAWRCIDLAPLAAWQVLKPFDLAKPQAARSSLDESELRSTSTDPLPLHQQGDPYLRSNYFDFFLR